MSPRIIKARLEAAAETCFRKQQEFHDSVVQYVAARAHVLRPLAYLEHCSHDATPLTLRTRGRDMESQILKVKVSVCQSGMGNPLGQPC